jgi:thiamine-phosphate pyrophosphorylase
VLRYLRGEQLILYYITDRRQLAGSAAEQRSRLLAKIAEASRAGVDLIQLREKDLPARELETLAREAVVAVRENAGKNTPRLLINSRIDVAIAAGADGVHLRGEDIAASEARVIFSKAGMSHPLIGVSCHTFSEVRLAESHGAGFAVFGPVFEKSGAPGQELDVLCAVCGKVPARGLEAAISAGQMPVLALGGVTRGNARACLQAGAAGIAGIRLFQENEIANVVEELKAGYRGTERQKIDD